MGLGAFHHQHAGVSVTSNYVIKFFSSTSLGNLSKHDLTGVDNAATHAKLLFVSTSKYVLVCHGLFVEVIRV